jgi:alkyl hydroperoxide reductase subunit AhpC
MLTRKYDLLDSNQGAAKHSFLLFDQKGIIRHKQIGDCKVAFNVEEALQLVIACKIPLFDVAALDGEYV